MKFDVANARWPLQLWRKVACTWLLSLSVASGAFVLAWLTGTAVRADQPANQADAATSKAEKAADKPAEAKADGKAPANETAAEKEKRLSKIRAQRQFGQLLKGLFSTPPDSEPTYEPTSLLTDQQTSRRLEEADRLYDDDRISQSLELLQAVLDETDATYVQDGNLWISSRERAHDLIVSRGPQFVKDYQVRYEPEAASLLRRGVAANDLRTVSEVARRFFLTKSGMEATNLLAAYQFDRGNPRLAIMHIDQLLDSDVHRDFVSDAVRMRRAIALALSGNREAAMGALNSLGETRVLLGGRPQSAESLRDELAALEKRFQSHAFRLADRDGEASDGLPMLLPLWSRPASEDPRMLAGLDAVEEINLSKQRINLRENFPMVIGSAVYHRTGKGTEKVDLWTGDVLWSNSEGKPADEQFSKSDQASMLHNGMQMSWQFLFPANSMYGSLSHDDTRLYQLDQMLVNPQFLTSSMPESRRKELPKAGENRLVALDLDTGKKIWGVGAGEKGTDPKLQGIFFLGPPLAMQGSLFVLGELRSELRLICLSPEDGALRWSQVLAVSDRRIESDVYRQTLAARLVEADGILLCPTNLHRLVAVDPLSRSILWDFVNGEDSLYLRSRQSETMPLPHDYSANDGLIVVGDQVIVSSTTGNSLYSLNLQTGLRNWRIARRPGETFLAGVIDDRLLVVGANTIRAVDLANGRNVWDRSLPAIPAGRGSFFAGYYLLPLQDGEIVSIDPVDGKTVAEIRSRRDETIGSLLATDDVLLGIGTKSLQAFPLLAHQRAKVDEYLASDPENARGLLLRAQVKLMEGKISESVADLLKVLTGKGQPAQRCQSRRILFEIAEREGLENPSELTRLVDELGPLATSDEDRAIYLRFRAEYALSAKNYELAMDSVERLMRLDLQQPILTAELHLQQTPSVWAHAFVSRLLQEVNPEDREKITDSFRRRVLTAVQRDDRDSLRVLASLLSGHPLGRKASLQLASYLTQDKDWLEAERELLEAVDPSNYARRVAAYGRLAELADQHGLREDAAYFRARGEGLTQQEAYVAVEDERDDRAIAATKNAASPASTPPNASEGKPALAPQAAKSDWGFVDGAKISVVTQSYSTPRYRQFVSDETELPYFRDRVLRLNERSFQLVFADRATGDEMQTVTLPRTRVVNHYSNTSVDRYCSVGHIFYVILGDRIYALSAIDPASESSVLSKGPVLLWSRQAVAGADPKSPKNQGKEQREDLFDADTMENGVRTVRFGPASPSAVTVINGKTLFAIDPITGKDLWATTKLPNRAEVEGDADYLFVRYPSADRRQRESIVLSTRDGQLLRRDDPVTRHYNPQGQVGRHCLLSENIRGKTVLRLWDPWSNLDLWRLEFPSASRLYAGKDGELVMLEPDRTIHCIDRVSGTVLFSDKLGKEEKGIKNPFASRSSINMLSVFSDDEHLYVGVDYHRVGYHRFMHVANGLTSHTVNGPLLAYDRKTYQKKWETELKSLTVVMGHRLSLPVLLAFETKQVERAKNHFELWTHASVIDRQTGKVVASKTFNGYTAFLEMAYSAKERWIELRSWNMKLRVDIPSNQTDANMYFIRKAAKAIEKAVIPSPQNRRAGGNANRPGNVDLVPLVEFLQEVLEPMTGPPPEQREFMQKLDE